MLLRAGICRLAILFPRFVLIIYWLFLYIRLDVLKLPVMLVIFIDRAKDEKYNLNIIFFYQYDDADHFVLTR